MTQAAQSIKNQLVEALAKADDPQMKTIILLMMHLQEEIGGKIDAVLADEKKIREIVLLDHTEEHDSDHVWIKGKRNDEADNKRSNRKIRDGVMTNVIWAIIAALGTFIATRLL